MANRKKICEKCTAPCSQRNGYTSIKPAGFPRYKHVCDHCKHVLGGYDGINKYLLPRFQAEGWTGTKL